MDVSAEMVRTIEPMKIISHKSDIKFSRICRGNQLSFTDELTIQFASMNNKVNLKSVFELFQTLAEECFPFD